MTLVKSLYMPFKRGNISESLRETVPLSSYDCRRWRPASSLKKKKLPEKDAPDCSLLSTTIPLLSFTQCWGAGAEESKLNCLQESDPELKLGIAAPALAPAPFYLSKT
jgi:hypothetical protein